MRKKILGMAMALMVTAVVPSFAAEPANVGDNSYQKGSQYLDSSYDHHEKGKWQCDGDRCWYDRGDSESN